MVLWSIYVPMGCGSSANIIPNKLYDMEVCKEGCEKDHDCIIWNEMKKFKGYGTNLLLIKCKDYYKCEIQFVKCKKYGCSIMKKTNVSNVTINRGFVGKEDRDNNLYVYKSLTESTYPEGWAFVEETLEKLGL